MSLGLLDLLGEGTPSTSVRGLDSGGEILEGSVPLEYLPDTFTYLNANDSGTFDVSVCGLVFNNITSVESVINSSHPLLVKECVQSALVSYSESIMIHQLCGRHRGQCQSPSLCDMIANGEDITNRIFVQASNASQRSTTFDSRWVEFRGLGSDNIRVSRNVGCNVVRDYLVWFCDLEQLYVVDRIGNTVVAVKKKGKPFLCASPALNIDAVEEIIRDQISEPWKSMHYF